MRSPIIISVFYANILSMLHFRQNRLFFAEDFILFHIISCCFILFHRNCGKFEIIAGGQWSFEKQIRILFLTSFWQLRKTKIRDRKAILGLVSSTGEVAKEKVNNSYADLRPMMVRSWFAPFGLRPQTAPPTPTKLFS